ncbi:MAG: cupredoxin family copper-binding protein [Bacteroidales bacterium]|nr:cupredoxin family copper-binding protein [Bacteroidales bacterium]
MNRYMKLFTMSMLAVFLFAACEEENNEDSNNDPGENEVWMEDIAFSPSEKNVSVGTTVKWINKDDVDHTVTSSEGLFDSGNIAAGEIYEYTFDSAGTYDYVCTLHSGMTGTVIVGETGSNGDDDNGGGGGDY